MVTYLLEMLCIVNCIFKVSLLLSVKKSFNSKKYPTFAAMWSGVLKKKKNYICDVYHYTYYDWVTVSFDLRIKTMILSGSIQWQLFFHCMSKNQIINVRLHFFLVVTIPNEARQSVHFSNYNNNKNVNTEFYYLIFGFWFLVTGCWKVLLLLSSRKRINAQLLQQCEVGS